MASVCHAIDIGKKGRTGRLNCENIAEPFNDSLVIGVNGKEFVITYL